MVEWWESILLPVLVKISAVDFVVILDALTGSCRIPDNAGIFMYTEGTRREMRDKISTILSEINIDIDTSTPNPVSPTSDIGV